LDEALDTAQAQFAYSLPDGLDTLIGDEGLSLSGGQRQRIALARAIAAKPKVLVLDDPLSALDVATEERVETRLRKVLAGTTTLIVAHRPSTVALADRVALLEEGRVAAVGTHAELLATSAHYRYVIASLGTEPRDLDTELSALEDDAEEVIR
ncbi:MAG: ABC transporter ATP-binding protein/permease, partial [Actinomycetota bacterium]|nr:ABC transporter ATP-binding protein/permease [Actinomycetota bacterium]